MTLTRLEIEGSQYKLSIKHVDSTDGLVFAVVVDVKVEGKDSVTSEYCGVQTLA